MSSIHSVILFISTTSKASVPCVEFVHQMKMPVILVRLDTAEDRYNASTGYYLKITEVPTLAIIFDKGEHIQLTIGTEKIIKRLNEFIEPPQPVVEPPPFEENRPPTIEEKPMKKKKKKTVKFDVEDIEILDKKPRKSTNLESKLLLGEKKASPSQDIYNMAKKMEKERSSTLGYKED